MAGVAAPRHAQSRSLSVGVFLFCAMLISGAVLLNQSAVHWRANVVDSHLFAYHGWCVTQGARPYLDFWDNKPPGVWLANALGFAVFGEGVVAEIAISAAALLVGLVCFVWAARLAYERSLVVPATLTGCVLLTHLVYECGANRTETFVVAFELLAICAFLAWWRGGALVWLVLAGFAAGAAPLFKQSGIAAGAAGVLFLLSAEVRGWRAARGAGIRRAGIAGWLAAGGGFVVAPLALLTWLGANGAVGAAWDAVGAFNRAYFVINDATWIRIDKALGIYREVIVYLAWLFVFVGVGAVWGLWQWIVRRRVGAPSVSLNLPDIGSDAENRHAMRANYRTPVLLFWLWFALSLYLACVGPGRRGHHFMPVLPSIGLLALYPLHLLAGGRGLWARVTARPTAAAIVIAFAYVLLQLCIVDVAELRRCWQVKPTWYATRYAVKPGYQRQGEAVAALCAPDERIYVWGWSPGTYRYAYRLPATRFATLEKVGQLGRHAEFMLDEVRGALLRDPPRVFVASDADLRGLLEDESTPIGAWLRADYREDAVIDGMHILVRTTANSQR